MKKLFFFLPLFLTLAGCGIVRPVESSTPLAALPEGCISPGTVEYPKLEATHSGYSYGYGLYLPPCFDADNGNLYPIVYLIPGRTSGPGTWFAAGAAAIADELIFSRELPPFLIVTTQNIDSGAEMYAATIVEDLMPYIESRYPVSPSRRHRSVGGGSLGSVAAYRIGFRFPDRFSAVGLFGGGAIAGEEDQIRKWLAAMPPESKPRVFLNSGFQDPYMQDAARVMMGLLDEAAIPHIHIFTDGGHNYAYWATYLPAYFHWLALDW
ncbi:MAG: alpha/beta hydrolase-fold protein [Anaerolineales bacterium]